jgi:hypothetical protein
VTADASATIAWLWLAHTPPDAEQARALSGWEEANRVELVAAPSLVPATIAVDPGVASAVEANLERARDASAARDENEVDRALDSAHKLLEAHAELPNAAWLMAEVERAHSAQWRRMPRAPGNEADRAWARAEALDGGRVAGLGETGSTERPQTATLSVPPLLDEQAWLDGELLAAGPVTSREGPHSLVVTWHGAPAWAGWIEVPPGPSTLPLPLLIAPTCSQADLERARIIRGSVDASGVRCPRWIAATTGLLPGAVRIAMCTAGRCEALLDWRSPPAWTWQPTERKGRARWPAWATWGLVGTGIAIGAAVAVGIAAGQAPPPETKFTSGGLKTP